MPTGYTRDGGGTERRLLAMLLKQRGAALAWARLAVRTALVGRNVPALVAAALLNIQGVKPELPRPAVGKITLECFFDGFKSQFLPRNG